MAFKWDCIEWMQIGSRALAHRDVVVAHETDGLLDPFADVQLYANTDIPRRKGEVEIERISEGWLLDGVLFPHTCWSPCHAS